MENEQGDKVDMYIPRKCSSSSRIISAKDPASVQMESFDVHPLTDFRFFSLQMLYAETKVQPSLDCKFWGRTGIFKLTVFEGDSDDEARHFYIHSIIIMRFSQPLMHFMSDEANHCGNPYVLNNIAAEDVESLLGVLYGQPIPTSLDELMRLMTVCKRKELQMDVVHEGLALYAQYIMDYNNGVPSRAPDFRKRLVLDQATSLYKLAPSIN